MTEERASELIEANKHGGAFEVRVDGIEFNIRREEKLGLFWYQAENLAGAALMPWFRINDTAFYNWLLQLEERT